MVGVVSTRHLITHPRAIVHEFGMGCYLRCVWRTVAAHRPVTFLECVEDAACAGAKTAAGRGAAWQRSPIALEPRA
jgi:hypothetical protein